METYLVKTILPSEHFDVCTLSHSLSVSMIEDVNVIDIFFVPYSELGNVVHWVHEIISCLTFQLQSAMDLIEINLWIPSNFLPPAIQILVRKIIKKHMPHDWEYECTRYNSAKFGDCVNALRSHIQLVKMCENGRGHCSKFTSDFNDLILSDMESMSTLCSTMRSGNSPYDYLRNSSLMRKLKYLRLNGTTQVSLAS